MDEMDSTKKYFSNVRKDVHHVIPSSFRTSLDIGCGEGSFSGFIKEKYKAETWGIEVLPAAAEVAKTILDTVLVGDVLGCLDQLPDKYFDCVFFLDSIEHMVDPDAVLRGIIPKLAPGGKVIASIPNVRYIGNLKQLVFGGDWRYEDAGVLDRTHLRFFTKKSIQRFFDESGFSVERLEGINAFNTSGWKYRLFLFLTGEKFRDTRFVQFVCVSTLR